MTPVSQRADHKIIIIISLISHTAIHLQQQTSTELPLPLPTHSLSDRRTCGPTGETACAGAAEALGAGAVAAVALQFWGLKMPRSTSQAPELNSE